LNLDVCVYIRKEFRGHETTSFSSGSILFYENATGTGVPMVQMPAIYVDLLCICDFIRQTEKTLREPNKIWQRVKMPNVLTNTKEAPQSLQIHPNC
jgi:hypothetical protein